MGMTGWSMRYVRECEIDELIELGGEPWPARTVSQMERNNHLTEVDRGPTITRQTSPYLGNENRPNFCFSLPSVRICLLMEFEHPFRKRDEVGYEVGKRRCMGLSEEGKEEGPRFAAGQTRAIELDRDDMS